MITQDTIAAISTAVLPAARIIIRLSGPNSLQIAKIISKQTAIAHGSAQQCMLWFCDLQCPGWIYAFHAPRSYTGEDTIEFHIPGNPVLARLLLDDLHRQGARPAEPGEFTARAFFNGKLGLTQAEGVAATIAAGNDAELLAARRLMAGELSRRLAPITEQLTQTLALIEVGIDFSEEDVTFLAHEEVSRRIQIADADLQTLLKHSARFEQLTHEPVIVLAGRPNAGKSTLINTLCGQERAVVADVSGTTRDVLTAPLNLKRGRVVLCDMAGLEPVSVEEHAQSRIDQQMQQRAQRAMESADHIVLVVDSTDPQLPLQLDRAPALLVQTKSDLKPASDVNWDLNISCKTGEGLQKLRDALDAIAFGQSAERTTLALNRRHLALIDEARVALSRAKISAADHASELVAMDLRDALDSLGSITGTVTPDDVLGRVFSAFCIGK